MNLKGELEKRISDALAAAGAAVAGRVAVGAAPATGQRRVISVYTGIATADQAARAGVSVSPGQMGVDIYQIALSRIGTSRGGNNVSHVRSD